MRARGLVDPATQLTFQRVRVIDVRIRKVERCENAFAGLLLGQKNGHGCIDVRIRGDAVLPCILMNVNGRKKSCNNLTRMVLDSGVFDAPHQSLDRFRACVGGLEAMAYARQACALTATCWLLPARATAGDESSCCFTVCLRPRVCCVRSSGVSRRLPAPTRRRSRTCRVRASNASRCVARVVRVLPADVRLHLVGHSMGGVVIAGSCRSWRRSTRRADGLPGSPSTVHATRAHAQPCGRDIVPSSHSSNAYGSDRGQHGSHLSIAAARDSVVTESALLPTGDHLIIKDCGHSGLLSTRASVVNRAPGAPLSSSPRRVLSPDPTGSDRKLPRLWKSW